MSEEMNPVSPRLVTSRYIHHLSWMFLLAAAAAAAGFWWTPWFYWAAGIFVGLFFWLLWLIPAQVRNMGWLETDDELLYHPRQALVHLHRRALRPHPIR